MGHCSAGSAELGKVRQSSEEGQVTALCTGHNADTAGEPILLFSPRTSRLPRSNEGVSDFGCGRHFSCGVFSATLPAVLLSWTRCWWSFSRSGRLWRDSECSPVLVRGIAPVFRREREIIETLSDCSDIVRSFRKQTGVNLYGQFRVKKKSSA